MAKLNKNRVYVVTPVRREGGLNLPFLAIGPVRQYSEEEGEAWEFVTNSFEDSGFRVVGSVEDAGEGLLVVEEKRSGTRWEFRRLTPETFRVFEGVMIGYNALSMELPRGVDLENHFFEEFAPYARGGV